MGGWFFWVPYTPNLHRKTIVVCKKSHPSTTFPPKKTCEQKTIRRRVSSESFVNMNIAPALRRPARWSLFRRRVGGRMKKVWKPTNTSTKKNTSFWHEFFSLKPWKRTHFEPPPKNLMVRFRGFFLFQSRGDFEVNMVVSFRGGVLVFFVVFLCSVSSCVSFFFPGDTWRWSSQDLEVDNFTVGSPSKWPNSITFSHGGDPKHWNFILGWSPPRNNKSQKTRGIFEGQESDGPSSREKRSRQFWELE